MPKGQAIIISESKNRMHAVILAATADFYRHYDLVNVPVLKTF